MLGWCCGWWCWPIRVSGELSEGLLSWRWWQCWQRLIVSRCGKWRCGHGDHGSCNSCSWNVSKWVVWFAYICRGNSIVYSILGATWGWSCWRVHSWCMLSSVVMVTCAVDACILQQLAIVALDNASIFHFADCGREPWQWTHLSHGSAKMRAVCHPPDCHCWWPVRCCWPRF